MIWGQACAEPLTLTETLFAQRHAVGHFRCFLGIPVATTLRAEYGDVVSFLSYCGTGGNRALHRAGCLDLLTAHYSTFPGLFRGPQLRIDVALVQVPPANPDGSYSLGLAHEYLGAALDAARVVIAEVNDQLPVIPGTRQLRPAEITVVVPTSRPPAELAPAAPDAVVTAVAAQVASLIDDGATLQVGIGSLSAAVLAALGDRRDLGIHSGMISDGVADLIEAGVVTNARKTRDRFLTVGGLLMGTRRLFDLAAADPSIQLRPTAYTHDIDVLAGIDSFVSVNAALEVDLLGQVNSERLGASYVGAVGGAVDFARGAARSADGIPVTALPSTSHGRSRIVPRLTVPASVPAVDAGVVVTEYGVADLRGRTQAQRAELLIQIAHPDHRAALDESMSYPATLQEIPS